MNELLSRAEKIFSEVADLPPEERAAILAEQRESDPELYALVERLLAHDQNGMGAFLAAPSRSVAAPSARSRGRRRGRSRSGRSRRPTF